MTDNNSGNEAGNVQTTEEINIAIEDMLKRSKRVKISGLLGQNSIAIGLKDNVEVTINGKAGDYLGAFNEGGIIIVNGTCGNYAGDTMISGGILIFGDCGNNPGACMKNGIIVIKGNVSGDAGELMSGGTMIIDGNVSGGIGKEMIDGTIIVTGNVGGRIGPGIEEGTMIIGGEASNLGNGISSARPSSKEISKLTKYFEHYGIRATPLSMTTFRRKG
jgi:glutamate synthase domain-containing protein 3